jgi:hypothetical protein
MDQLGKHRPLVQEFVAQLEELFISSPCASPSSLRTRSTIGTKAANPIASKDQLNRWQRIADCAME